MKWNRAFCLLSMFTMSIGQLWAQTESNTPKYIARNQDFVDRRATDGSAESFAELYQKAYEETQLLRGNISFKRSNTWTPFGPMGNERLAGTGRINSITFHPTDTSIFFICVAQGGIWKTTNSGKSWTSVSGDLPILRTTALAIHPTKPETMYVAMGDFAYIGHNIFANDNKRNTHYGLGVYKTVNGGKTWTATGLSLKQEDYEASLLSNVLINPNNPDVVMAAGQTGIYRSVDAGKNWTKTHSGLVYDMKTAQHSSRIIYASTGAVTEYNFGSAGIMRSTDFGKTWVDAKVPFRKRGSTQRIELAPSRKNPAKIYALACDAKAWTEGGGGFYGLFMSKDSGFTYSTVIDSTYINMLNGRFDNAPGGQGRYDLAMYTDDQNEDIVSVAGVNLWTSVNGGSHFEPSTYWALNYQRLSMHGDVHEIEQHPVTGRIFICHDGGLSSTMKFEQEGDSMSYARGRTKFTHYTKNLQITSFYRLAVHRDSATSVMAGAQDNSTALSSTNGWRNLSGGDGMESAFNEDFDEVYTSSQYGYIYQYLNFGSYYAYSGRISAPTGEVAEWTTPFTETDGRLWIGYGNVYYHSSFGNGRAISSFSEAPNRSYPRPSTALYVNPDNTDIIYLAKRGFYLDQVDAKVWGTLNGGDTWTDISAGLPVEHYPTYLTAKDDDPKELWISFASWEKSEKVYHSTDGGKNWENISYNLPNIPVNCVAYQNDSNGFVYLGTDLGVYYLDDENDEWVLYSDGLPNVIVHELDVHLKSHTLKAATFGRGVWEVRLLGTPTGITKTERVELEINLFPNPTRDLMQVQLSASLGVKTPYRIIDITGKTVLDGTIPEQAFNIDIHTRALLSGQYYLVIETGNNRLVKSFEKVD